MQFGITDHVDANGLAPGEQFEQRLQLIERYEQLGFARYHLTEHHGTPLGRVPSPNVFIAAASQRTSTIGLGAMIYVLPLYHPVRLIEEIGMLDHLTGGRLEVGVGRGASPIEAKAYGVEADETRDLFFEVFEILTTGLESDVLEYDGNHYKLEDVLMVLPPVQRPRPMLWAAVSSPERAAWAAEHGINAMSLVPPGPVRTFSDAFAEAWERTGRPIEERPLRGANRNLVIADTEAEAHRIADEAWTGFHSMLAFLWRRAGMPDPPQFPAKFSEAQQRGTAFAGTPEQAREFVAEQVEVSGLDCMHFHLAFGNISFEHTVQTAELFAEHVMPAFAEAGV